MRFSSERIHPSQFFLRLRQPEVAEPPEVPRPAEVPEPEAEEPPACGDLFSGLAKTRTDGWVG